MMESKHKAWRVERAYAFPIAFKGGLNKSERGRDARFSLFKSVIGSTKTFAQKWASRPRSDLFRPLLKREGTPFGVHPSWQGSRTATF
jgi:hypothetical protein